MRLSRRNPVLTLSVPWDLLSAPTICLKLVSRLLETVLFMATSVILRVTVNQA